MKVSIVTPSLNQGKFVGECVQSVIQQAYAPIEHIVVDGGSSDNTVSILRRYALTRDGHDLCWISERDKGQSDALNKGFNMATGDIVGWLNADDRYRPGCFRVVAEAFRTNPQVDIIYGDYNWIDEYGRVGRIRRESKFNPFVLKYHRVLVVPTTTSFFRRKIFEDGNFLDLQYNYAMDYEFFLRLAEKGYQFKHVRRLLADFRWHKESKSTIHAKEQFEERDRILECYSPLLRAMQNGTGKRFLRLSMRAVAGSIRYGTKLLYGQYFDEFKLPRSPS